ncbi:MAG: hypothetical protein CW716_03540 [Candidatus Bathyarchaeum sp.]|nr:MAG: hypothetical protein CW716_03540 [Candidatus Bathyarchaeum sp.]
MKDITTNIAYTILFVGIGLLAFTFISAYIFLINDPTITGSSNLVDAFGSALAPLIGASIRIMYLGIMGWIGAGLTARGIQLIIQLKRLATLQSQPQASSVINQTEPVSAKKAKGLGQSS